MANKDFIIKKGVIVTDDVQINSSGDIIKLEISSWGSNSTQQVIRNAYNSTIGDHLLVKAAGNGSADHGAIVISDNVFSYGRTTSGGQVDASLTSPLPNSVSFTVDHQGNANFAGSITSDDVIYAADSNSNTSPSFSFKGHTDTGLSIQDNGSADRLNFLTDGVTRAYVNVSGLFSQGNVYSGNSAEFRNYGGTWKASTGVTGNGFEFVNTVDGTAMTLSADGDMVIYGNLEVRGTQTILNTATLTVDDLNITIADGAANAAAANGAGITVDGANATLTYTSAQDEWNFNKNLVVGVKETTASFPLMVKSNTAHKGLHIEENSGAESWQMGVNVTGDLNFYNSGSATPSITFEDSGDVGIGTDTPNTKLHVAGNQYIDGNLQIKSPGVGNAMSILQSTSGNVVAKMGESAIGHGFLTLYEVSVGDVIKFDANANSFINRGNFGIGTTTPDSKLTVNVTSNGDGIELQSSEVTIATLDRTVVGGQVVASLDGVASRPIHIGGVINEDVILANAGGNVGIGISSPQGKLHINTESAEATNVYIDGEVSQDKLLRFRHYGNSENAGATAYQGFIGSVIDNVLTLGHYNSSGTEVQVLHLTEAGNVGIGTDSPDAKLHVKGAVQNLANQDYGIAAFENTNLEGLTIGYDADGNHSFMYSREVGVSSRGLRLNGAIYISSYDGNVGIGTGTNTLSNKLQVDGVASIFDGLRLGSAASGEGLIRFGGATANGIGITTGALSSPNIKLFVAHGNDGGGVGIGTTTPGRKLHVKGEMVIEGTTVSTMYARPTSTYASAGFKFLEVSAVTSNSPYTTEINFSNYGDSNVMTISGDKVGIGQTNPNNTLDVESSDSVVAEFKSTTDIARIALTSVDSGDGASTGYIKTQDGKLTLDADIGATGSDPRVTFEIEGNESVRINAGGVMGVGEENPQAKLHVSHATAPTFRLSRTGTGQIWQQSIDSSGRFQIKEAASEGGTKYARLTIDDTGEVGIGTDAPSEKLEVSGGHIKITNSGNANLYINANAVGSDATIFFEENDGVKAKIQHDASNDSMLFTDGAYADTMTLKSAKVGIGTTDPLGHLHLSSSSGHTKLIIEADTDNNDEEDNPYLLFHTDGGLRTGAITGGNATYENNSATAYNQNALNLQGYKLRFHTAPTQDYDNATERMIINESGNVGIGRGVPQAKLHIGGSDLLNSYTTSRTTLAVSDTTNGAELILRGQSPRIWFDGTSSGNGQIYMDSSELQIYSGSPGTVGTQRLNINSSGAITFNNAYTFPTAAGNNGDVLVSDGSGNLSFAAQGGTITSATNMADNRILTASGSTTINAESNLSYNGTSLTVVGRIDLDDANTQLDKGSGNSLRVTTNSGYIELGPQNTSWAHISTDRSNFYFNRPLTVDSGLFVSYDEDLILRRARNTSYELTLKTTGLELDQGKMHLKTGLYSANNEDVKLRQYHLSTGDAGGSFLLGKIENSANADGGVEGIVRFAHDYGSSTNNCAIHFHFAQRSGTARGTWWYEHDDQEGSADRVHVRLIDDGSGNMYVWATCTDYAKTYVEATWRQCTSVTDSGTLTAGTLTTGTTLFDTANNPTSQMHIGGLFTHSASTFTGNCTFNGSSNQMGGSIDFADDVLFEGNNTGGVFYDNSDDAFEFSDNARAKFGNNSDLAIYHESSTSNSYIKEGGAGNLYISADNLRLTNFGITESYLNADANGAVTLYYDGAPKLATTSTGVTVTGLLSATTKSFDIPHPSKEDWRLRYGSLEGPENGVYVRGKSKEKVILLPDYWVDLVHEDSITVQLTAIGKGQDLYVEDIKDNKVYVNGDNYFYYIQAERKDVEKLEVEYEN